MYAILRKITSIDLNYPILLHLFPRTDGDLGILRKKTALPEHMQEKEPESSRMLKALLRKNRKEKQNAQGDISFGSYRKEVPGNV